MKGHIGMKNLSNLPDHAAKNTDEGIRRILEEAYEKIGNPIVIFDTSYNVLLYTENKVKDDFLWNELIQLGTFHHKTVDFFSQEKFIESFAHSEVVTLMQSEKLKYDRVNGKLFDSNGIHFANICVMACYKNFTQEDFLLIEEYCNALSLQLQKSIYDSSLERGFNESCIATLIEDKYMDRFCNIEEVEKLYLNLKENLYVMIIDITQYESTLTHLIYFKDLFESIQPEYKYFTYLNNIVVLVSEDHVIEIKKDLAKLNAFFKEHNIYAAISTSFQNLYELNRYYKEALYALNYGMNDLYYADRNIFNFQNSKIQRIHDILDKDMDLTELHHPIVLMIKEHDKENNSTYFDILYTYLLYGLNLPYTANHLNISESCLLSKLKDYDEIFGIDWTNGTMIFNIFYTMKLLLRET